MDETILGLNNKVEKAQRRRDTRTKIRLSRTGSGTMEYGLNRSKI